MSMKTIAKCSYPHEAHLLRIKLEAIEIPAIVLDDETASVAPYLTQAIGGVRVQVPEHDVARAREALHSHANEADVREDQICPSCGAGEVDQDLHAERSFFGSFFMSGLFGVPVPLVRRRYRCMACEHLWD